MRAANRWLGQKLAELDAAFAPDALPASDAPVAAKPGQRRVLSHTAEAGICAALPQPLIVREHPNP